MKPLSPVWSCAGLEVPASHKTDRSASWRQLQQAPEEDHGDAIRASRLCVPVQAAEMDVKSRVSRHMHTPMPVQQALVHGLSGAETLAGALADTQLWGQGEVTRQALTPQAAEEQITLPLPSGTLWIPRQARRLQIKAREVQVPAAFPAPQPLPRPQGPQVGLGTCCIACGRLRLVCEWSAVSWPCCHASAEMAAIDCQAMARQWQS